MTGPVRVLIVAASLGGSARHTPLGAARIVSALKACPASAGKIEPELLAVTVPGDPARLARTALDRRPRAVGFSLYVWNRDLLLAAARDLRRDRPDLVLFAGGPEATADPAGVRAEGGLDFVVEGEGEESAPLALERALAGADPGEVPGVLGSGVPAPDGRDREPVVSARAPGVPARVFGARAREPGVLARAELSRVPSPYLDGTLNVSEYGGGLWELARGCPFACHFCYESKGCRGVRSFPDEVVRAELRAFVRGGAREVFVLDPTFNADPARARDILTLLRREAPGIHFTFEIRSEFLDAAQARLFGSIPCSVQVGLQSARPEVLAVVGRPGFDRKEFRRRTAMLSAAGVVFGLDLIYGLPGDDLAGFRESLDYALSLEPNHLDVFRLSVLPGTVLADR
ncbi:MAG TPA: radical SAM protein, partial [Spirochaetia bacterium]|nr:radical SAM protein [Spirochaetia bacterium]